MATSPCSKWRLCTLNTHLRHWSRSRRRNFPRGAQAEYQIGNAVKLPNQSGNALKNVCAEIFELDAGARHDILDGAHDEDVVGTSKPRYPRCDV